MNPFRDLSRRDAMKLMTAAMLTGCGQGGVPRVVSGKPDGTNVLFIVVDDLRPELGCYGASHVHSPRIDELASTGVTFDRAYCQQAVCSPSRSSVLTGLRPQTTGIDDLSTHIRDVAPEVTTLPQAFRQGGYHSFGYGKIYHGNLNDAASWSEPHRRLADPRYQLRENRQAYRRKHGEGDAERGPVIEAADLPDEQYADTKLTLAAIERMGQLNREGKSFFAAVGLHKPHLPWVAPKKYFDLYDPASLPLSEVPVSPAGTPAYLSGEVPGEVSGYAGAPQGPEDVTEDVRRELLHAYLACVTFTDANVGRLLDALRTLGVEENTIVAFWGDHGFHLGDYGMWGKHTNMEVAARSPLIIRTPGMTAGSRGATAAGLVELVDLYPTLLELTGCRVPGWLEGTSMAPLLDKPERAWKAAAFTECPRRTPEGTELLGRSVRTDRWRYTEWRTRGMFGGSVHQRELYDHQHDPLESVNLADDAKHAAQVKDLAGVLDRGWRAYRSPA